MATAIVIFLRPYANIHPYTTQVIMYVTEICRGADEMAASENVPAADVAFLRSASLAQTRALLDACVVDFNVVSLFVKALQISTWIFKMKVHKNI